jgi:hypothetical protein
VLWLVVARSGLLAVTHTGPCSASPLDSGWVPTRTHFAAFSMIPFRWPGGHGWAHFVCKSSRQLAHIRCCACQAFLLVDLKTKESAMSSFHPHPLGLPGHAPTSHFVVAFAAGYHGYSGVFSTRVAAVAFVSYDVCLCCAPSLNLLTSRCRSPLSTSPPVQPRVTYSLSKSIPSTASWSELCTAC